MTRKPAQDFGLFLLGSALFAAGIFLFTNQVLVSSGMHGLGWGRGFGRGMGGSFGGFLSLGGSQGQGMGLGLLMIPFGIGVTLLLADVQRKVGWFLVWAASAALGAAVLQSLIFSFRPASLWSLITMVVMIGGGGGLMFKSLRDYSGKERQRQRSDQSSSSQEIERLREELEQLKSRLNDQ